MSRSDSDFLDYLRELLAGVPELRMRGMFGGHGPEPLVHFWTNRVTG